jgi:chromate reductase, NAD(P)H dehydrogenase (quinone)
MRLVALSGSLRADSHNRRLLAAAVRALPDDIEVVEAPRLHDVPPFDEDREGDLPAAIEALGAAIRDADAVLIATPEYNASVPGHLKNALDWVSRPFEGNPLHGKPVLVIGGSTGMFGAAWAQADLKRILGAIGARALDAGAVVPRIHEAFDDDGHPVDAAVRDQLEAALAALLDEVRVAA